MKKVLVVVLLLLIVGLGWLFLQGKKAVEPAESFSGRWEAGGIFGYIAEVEDNQFTIERAVSRRPEFYAYQRTGQSQLVRFDNKTVFLFQTSAEAARNELTDLSAADRTALEPGLSVIVNPQLEVSADIPVRARTVVLGPHITEGLIESVEGDIVSVKTDLSGESRKIDLGFEPGTKVQSRLEVGARLAVYSLERPTTNETVVADLAVGLVPAELVSALRNREVPDDSFLESGIEVDPPYLSRASGLPGLRVLAQSGCGAIPSGSVCFPAESLVIPLDNQHQRGLCSNNKGKEFYCPAGKSTWKMQKSFGLAHALTRAGVPLTRLLDDDGKSPAEFTLSTSQAKKGEIYFGGPLIVEAKYGPAIEAIRNQSLNGEKFFKNLTVTKLVSPAVVPNDRIWKIDRPSRIAVFSDREGEVFALEDMAIPYTFFDLSLAGPSDRTEFCRKIPGHPLCPPGEKGRPPITANKLKDYDFLVFIDDDNALPYVLSEKERAVFRELSEQTRRHLVFFSALGAANKIFSPELFPGAEWDYNCEAQSMTAKPFNDSYTQYGARERELGKIDCNYRERPAERFVDHSQVLDFREFIRSHTNNQIKTAGSFFVRAVAGQPTGNITATIYDPSDPSIYLASNDLKDRFFYGNLFLGGARESSEALAKIEIDLFGGTEERIEKIELAQGSTKEIEARLAYRLKLVGQDRKSALLKYTLPAGFDFPFGSLRNSILQAPAGGGEIGCQLKDSLPSIAQSKDDDRQILTFELEKGELCDNNEINIISLPIIVSAKACNQRPSHQVEISAEAVTGGSTSRSEPEIAEASLEVVCP